MVNKRIIFIGGGSLCRELMSLLMFKNKKIDIFYLDKIKKKFPKESFQPKYLGLIENYIPRQNDELYLTISSPQAKFKIVEKFPRIVPFIKNFIHPSCVIAQSSKIGKGCIIYPFSYISECSVIEDYVTINAYCDVGHDSKIGRFTTVSPYTGFAGNTSVGQKCFFGLGAKVIPNIIIGDNCNIGACSLVVKKISPNTKVFGQPAKKF